MIFETDNDLATSKLSSNHQKKNSFSFFFSTGVFVEKKIENEFFFGPTRTIGIIQEYLTKHINTIRQAPYSPDRGPCDFFFFSRLKLPLRSMCDEGFGVFLAYCVCSFRWLLYTAVKKLRTKKPFVWQKNTISQECVKDLKIRNLKLQNAFFQTPNDHFLLPVFQKSIKNSDFFLILHLF